jgi:hypothetical protein
MMIEVEIKGKRVVCGIQAKQVVEELKWWMWRGLALFLACSSCTW